MFADNTQGGASLCPGLCCWSLSGSPRSRIEDLTYGNWARRPVVPILFANDACRVWPLVLACCWRRPCLRGMGARRPCHAAFPGCLPSIYPARDELQADFSPGVQIVTPMYRAGVESAAAELHVRCLKEWAEIGYPPFPWFYEVNGRTLFSPFLIPSHGYLELPSIFL